MSHSLSTRLQAKAKNIKDWLQGGDLKGNTPDSQGSNPWKPSNNDGDTKALASIFRTTVSVPAPFREGILTFLLDRFPQKREADISNKEVMNNCMHAIQIVEAVH